MTGGDGETMLRQRRGEGAFLCISASLMGQQSQQFIRGDGGFALWVPSADSPVGHKSYPVQERRIILTDVFPRQLSPTVPNISNQPT